MSFGFGVGDFLAVLELAKKVRQKWKDAPEEYDTMKDETENVSDLLENIHKLLQQGALSDEHIAQIRDNSARCLKVLQRCESLTDKFPATAIGHSSWKSTWKRLRLDPGDVRAVRDQLTSCVVSLNALLTAFQSFQVNKISKGVDDIHDRQARALFEVIADWYSSDNFAKHHDDHLSLRLPGTGLWALNDVKYKQWEDGDTNTLLCPGIPGSGKSILHATLVDDLRSRHKHDDSVVVVYFYCNFQRQPEQTVRNILSTLVRQMFQERNHLPAEVKALYNKHYPRKTNPSVGELEQLLCSLVKAYHKVFVMIDALDECMSEKGDCMEFLDKIFDLQRLNSATKLLVTTRWLPHIIERFGACPQVEIRAHQEDIERYLDHNLPRLEVKLDTKIKVDDTVVTIQDAVKSRITDAADGMFLVARLQFDSLTDKTTPRKLQQALLQLCRGSKALDTEYDKALVRIHQQREGFREIAYKVLQWIVFAQQELSVAELREAVAIYEGMEDIDYDMDLEEEQQLASVCAGLVRVDQQAGVMRLVHYTTQEYLKNALPKRNKGEVSIARDCLTYLSMDVFKQSVLDQTGDTRKRVAKFKLLQYAKSHWGKHIKPEFEQDLIPYIDGLLFSPELFQVATELLLVKTHPSVSNLSPAHVCVYFDLASTISRIIDQKGAFDGRDNLGKTPLLWAAAYGRTKIASLLLEESDVSVNSRDNHGQTPLSMAILNKHIGVVKILLRRADIDVNTISKCVLVLLFKGHKYVLYNRGVRIESHRRGDPTLCTSTKIGNTDIVKLLFKWLKLTLDEPTPSKFSRDLEILEVLMEHTYIRDDPSAFTEAELLDCAAVYGTAEVMEYLLSFTDTNLNMGDSHLSALLRTTVRDATKGRSEIANALLERHEVNADISDHCGRTTLSYAAARGAEYITKCLLQRPEVNPDSSDSCGRTPLSWAAECGSYVIAKLLLQRSEVNPDSIDHAGRTPLSYAAGRGNLPIVEALLRRSEVNPDSSDHHGRTPLSYAAATSESQTVVRLLLEEPSVRPNSKDHRGRAPLSYAAETGYYAVETLLESPRIDMGASDHSGRTPFQRSLESSENSAKLFLRQWLGSSDSAEAFATVALKLTRDIGRNLDKQPLQIVSLLGHCLLLLGYRDWAVFAFQQRVVVYPGWPWGNHSLTKCDGCPTISIRGKRFICVTCLDTNLCAACMKQYTKGERIKDGGCVNHEFLEVPGEEINSESWSRLNRPAVTITGSLEDGVERASVNQSDLDSSSSSGDSDHWRTGIKKIYRHWGF